MLQLASNVVSNNVWHQHLYCTLLARGEGVVKKSTLCTLAKRLKIVDHPKIIYGHLALLVWLQRAAHFWASIIDFVVNADPIRILLSLRPCYGVYSCLCHASIASPLSGGSMCILSLHYIIIMSLH